MSLDRLGTDYPYNQRLTAPSGYRSCIGIDYVNWSSSRKGDDLVENVTKLRLVLARYWSEKFNVSRDELESAANKVGVMPDDVEHDVSNSS